MTNPTSGTYDAIIESSYYCWGDACQGKTKLNWNCTDSDCNSIGITGKIPSPSIIPQTGSPTIEVSLPQLNNVGRWNSGTGSINGSSSSCANGTMNASTQQTSMKFTMSGDLLNFCGGSDLTAQFQVSPFVCSHIPYTNFNYCYDKSHPQFGFFVEKMFN